MRALTSMLKRELLWNLRSNYEGIVLRKENHWITRIGGLKDCCVLVFGFMLSVTRTWWCYSILVDSHACDEILWQEPGKSHYRATPACLELLVNTQQP